MLIRRLSKIGITLLLAVSFIMPVSFSARADFTSTDSSNLNKVEENTANTVTRLGTTNSWLSQIKTELVSLNTEVSNIKTAVANTITTTLNQINTKVGNIYSAVDQLEGYLDTVETKLSSVSTWLDTINGNIVTMGNYVSSINSTETANGTVLTDIYNLLNTSTETQYLRDIRAEMLKISDNIVFNRSSNSADTITLSNNATLGQVSYTLKPVTLYTFSVVDNVLTPSGSQSYGNFHNHIMANAGNILGLTIAGFNYIHNRLFTDLEYIGTELHLAYVLINNFKTANHTDILGFWSSNHTDITAFKSAFDSWVNLWKQPAKLTYIMKDVLSVRRIEEDPSTITLNTFDGTITYSLWSYNQKYLAYNSNSHHFNVGEQLRYVNFPGMLHMALWGLNESFCSIGNYLNDTSPADTITQSVATLDQNLTNLNNAETAASTDAISRINSFVPNISDISSLVALSWCSTFLQNLYLALGTFNIPILCGLVLAVCMQFIGYFRYKT